MTAIRVFVFGLVAVAAYAGYYLLASLLTSGGTEQAQAMVIANVLAVVVVVAAIVIGVIASQRGMRILQIAAIALVFSTSLYGIGQIQDRMLTMRDTQILEQYDVPMRNAPWYVAVTTIALGGFRGLLADVLFLRSEAMKERQQYFELVQLGSWIVKLQPHMTGVAAFLAWNMAYNVSVMFSSHEDRWRWVSRGVELLRDEALVYNPDDPKLYKELGWIYQHKMGNILDDAHRYYKVMLARQIMTATGYPLTIDWKALAEAPQTPEALDATLGPVKAAKLHELLKSDNMNLGQFEYAFRQANGEISPSDLEKKLADAGVLDSLKLYLHSRWVHEVYKIDPVFAWKLTQEYGPLDFRLPEAHAVYWARQGAMHAPGGKDVDCRRMIGQSLSQCFKSGKLLYISPDGNPFIGPNPKIADAATQAFLDNADMFENNRSFLSGYENFLKDAIVILYTSGDRTKAAEYFKKLRDKFQNPVYLKTDLDTFALKEWGMDISGKSLKQMESMIADLLSRYYLSIALGDDDGAVISLWMARQIQTKMNKEKTPDTRLWNRTAIQDIGNPDLRKAVLIQTMLSLPPDLAMRLKARFNVSDEDIKNMIQALQQQQQELMKRQGAQGNQDTHE